MTEETLFHEALAIPSGERAAFLDAACAGQPQLRAAVEALLAAHDASGSLLDEPPAGLGQTVDSDPGAAHPQYTGEYTSQPDESPPQPIPTTDYHPNVEPGLVIAGRYKLVEKIGEGGMGEVWVAKQTEPVKRKVALKLIKTGMDSRAVLSRFEQERQALAMMDHPNIARVLDGGMTPTGQPFFVMDLVNGLPLTRFCDEAKLTTRDRLDLFVPICQAVQHAHQKGIVHRDLKPANILVTLIDGKPVPKVIDFGVAKATGGKLTDESLSTQFGAVVGTLEYMSPEQAGYSGSDIDTRADIYSLGVILYELLTGLRPIDAKRLKKAALTEMIRIIQEEEPSKPSTRLSTDESLPSLAALRQTEPRKLMALLRGELDWVVMKCLEKHRERRYDTANGLARDIQRYLADELVEARPPSTGYRLKKFVHRHKGEVVAASLVFLALLGGIWGTSWGLVLANQSAGEERRARHDAEVQTERAEKGESLAKERLVQSERALEAMTIMLEHVQKRLKGEPAGQKLREDLVRLALEELDKIRASTEKAALADRRGATAHSLLGDGYLEGERAREAAEEYDVAISIFDRLVKEDPQDHANKRNLAAVINKRGDAALRLRDAPRARDYYQQALDLRMQWAEMTPERVPPLLAIANSYGLLGKVSLLLGDPRAALDHYLASKEYYDKLPGEALGIVEVRRELAALEDRLGEVYSRTGNEEASRKHYLESLRRREELLKLDPKNHDFIRDYALSQISEGHWNLTNANNPVSAYAHYDAALQQLQQIARDDPNSANARRDGAAVRYYLGATALRIGAELPGFLGVGWLATSRFHFDRCMKVREDLAKIDPGAQRGLMLAQARCGRHVEAAATAQRFAALNDPDNLFQAACRYALSAGAVRTAGASTPADRALAARYLDGAFAVLAKLVKIGWKDPVALQTDPDLDPIRTDPRYPTLVKDVRTAAGGK